MRFFFLLPLGLALPLRIHVLGATVNPLHRRQIDCSSYGEFEPYTGACETTNCGAQGRNCDAEGFSGCVGFPNVQCPLKGCACTNY
ncbi:hypothetical protein K505DRAFT_144576 [Melanomma pulvis-pyrius CBS 109.77]|uniref:Uncharacterized protein n=1 Tax=Melanomma pulvis-pyrius CBS 109.77 TaxID=1314802 RepID=A0A6A6XMA4_9PLEO|nr:hypothetical protein K505DRAFT_144576 [Melanomma pulvis-pyrius CBS 109.77]